MRMFIACAFALLFAAGCSTYPESQGTYSTSGATPVYGTTTTTYPSTATQGAAATTQIITDTDRALTAVVRQALNNAPNVAPIAPSVYINSRNGTVTLTGTVPTEQDRQFIDNVVRNTSGVYSVNDQMQVVAPATGAVETTRVYSTTTAPVYTTTETRTPVYTTTQTAPVYTTTQPAQVVADPNAAGNLFNLHVQGLNEPDRTLGQRILQELRTDTALPTLLPVVNITVADGRVTLDGNVQSEHQRRAIEAAVQRAAGVSTVSDRLQVTYPPR